MPALAFPANHFDCVVSLLCLYSVEDKADQARACREIARVLKPGGRTVVGDYVPTHAYAAAFADAGVTVAQSRNAFAVALSRMFAEKAASGALSDPLVRERKTVTSPAVG